MRRTLTGMAAALALSAPVAMAQPQPAPPNAELFAGCFAAAAAAHSYVRDGRYLLFTCNGPAAQAFFDHLADRPPGKGYEETRPDGLHRFTERPKKDTSGLDECWRLAAPAAGQPEFGCTLTFPAGAFLDG